MRDYYAAYAGFHAAANHRWKRNIGVKDARRKLQKLELNEEKVSGFRLKFALKLQICLNQSRFSNSKLID